MYYSDFLAFLGGWTSLFYFYLVAALVILLDQLSKWWILHSFELGESMPVIDGFFMITSHRNKGAAFGILQDQRTFFIIITIVIVIGLIWYLAKSALDRKNLLAFSLSLILGGALGNFIDRVRMGEVVDFLHFRFRFSWFGTEVDYSYPIFNLADSAICIGVALVFLDTFLEWRKERKRRKAYETP
jgi:signal peptidase II